MIFHDPGTGCRFLYENVLQRPILTPRDESYLLINYKTQYVLQVLHI